MNIEQKVLGEMCFGEELVVLDLAAASDLEVLDQMAARMLAEGMVKESYAAAIKKRESVYATGLELPEMGIAIPHTDPEHVNTPALCLGILREPVSFGAMGMADQRVDVRVVFMLSIKEPHAQLKVLQALMKVFQEEGRLTALTACATPPGSRRQAEGTAGWLISTTTQEARGERCRASRFLFSPGDHSTTAPE